MTPARLCQDLSSSLRMRMREGMSMMAAMANDDTKTMLIMASGTSIIPIILSINKFITNAMNHWTHVMAMDIFEM